MANITTELSDNNTVKITFARRQGKHLRLTGSWTDWMLAMEDFRDFIIPLPQKDIDFIITEIVDNSNSLKFVSRAIGQEYKLDSDKKIVRRVGPGRSRKEYQSVALFIKNNAKIWPPKPIKIRREDILSLMKAMITLNCPTNYYVTDSLRNLQFLSSILWVKKKSPKLLQGIKKPKANEIFRISLVK